MNLYTIYYYDFRNSPVDMTTTIEADTAEEAVIKFAQNSIPGIGNPVSFTKKNQNANDIRDRDNAHAQFNFRGTIGAAACLAGREEEYKQ